MPRRRARKFQQPAHRAACTSCGVTPLFEQHRCIGTWIVKIPGRADRARRVLAASEGEAAVRLADDLDRSGSGEIESGTELIARVRRAGDTRWIDVVLTAVDVTTYHPTIVQAAR